MFLQHIQELVVLYPEFSALVLILAKIVGALVLFPGTPLTLLAGATFGAVLKEMGDRAAVGLLEHHRDFS